MVHYKSIYDAFWSEICICFTIALYQSEIKAVSMMKIHSMQLLNPLRSTIYHMTMKGIENIMFEETLILFLQV